MRLYKQNKPATCGLVAFAHAIHSERDLEFLQTDVEKFLGRRLGEKFIDPETKNEMVSGVTTAEMSCLLSKERKVHSVFDLQAYSARSLYGYNIDRLSGTRWPDHVFMNGMPAVLGVIRTDELYNSVGHWIYVEEGKIIDGLKDSPFGDWDGIQVLMGCLIRP